MVPLALSHATRGRRAAPRSLRVLVVDDHDVVHWGFRLMLGEQPWVERFLQRAHGRRRRWRSPQRYEPHVALVDLFLGDESGAEICRAAARSSPMHPRILLISGAGRISPSAAARRRRRRASSPRTGRARDVADAVQHGRARA